MTPSTAPVFEQGETYKMFVLNAYQDNAGSFIIVQDDKSGKPFRVEIKGDLKGKVFSLKGQHVSLICTGLTEKDPDFTLVAEYFEKACYESPQRGSNIGRAASPIIVFKQSFFHDPISNNNHPNDDQPFAIAKQIAAFMNTSGGDLYLGVDGDGFVTGVESDFPLLNKVPIMMDTDEDKGHSYSLDIAGYIQKITNALITYLGQDGAALIPPVKVLQDKETGLTYLWIHTEPSPSIIYLGRALDARGKMTATRCSNLN